MTIISEDGERYVDIGGYDIWNCLYSTVIMKLQNIRSEIDLAISFLETGVCESNNCMKTAKELNIIRDKLSMIPTSELVYDHKHPNQKAPWQNKISPIVTSCGNLFTTSDGKDLIFELTVVLFYCYVKKLSVIVQ